jgi:transposase
MDLRIREVKTGSGKTVVQVFRMEKGVRKILKHFGSADVKILREQAVNWVKENTVDISLFKEEQEKPDPYFNNYKVVEIKYTFAYEFLNSLISKLNLKEHLGDLFKDVIIAQILEPSSKRQNILNLNKYFGIKYDVSKLYRVLKIFNPNQKEVIEKQIIEVAKKHFNFDFNFVLYDVTTLYFESFKNDEFKRPGFSKDNKSNQPQIVIGLIVNQDGFPVSYEVFKGNTFEGNTFLPILLNFKEKHKVKTLTVVADAAMVSKLNLEKLKENHINYIIGARLAKQSQNILDQIQKQITRTDKFSIRINELVVEYKEDRYKKDKLDLEKQIERAKTYVGNQTAKLKKMPLLKNHKTEYFLDTDLVDRKIKLLGLKGYVTNLNLSNQEIINYYHNLFKVEHAFRLAKSDLEMRPIYHFKESSIKNHILICFVALAISVYLEIKNCKSIKFIVGELMSVIDTHILNKNTNKILIDRVNPEVRILH